jgi:hypothetical protein
VILGEGGSDRSRESSGSFITAGGDSYRLCRKKGVEYDTESLGSVVTTRNDPVVFGEGGSDRSRESLGSFSAAGNDSDKLRRKGGKEADFSTGFSGSSGTNGEDSDKPREKSFQKGASGPGKSGPKAVGASKNEIAASSLMASLEEKWKEGGLSSLSTLESGRKKIRRPEGVSEEFLRAVEETATVVQNYFTPSGGSSWPSVAEVVLECYIAADQVYGEDRANKFAENHRWRSSY